MFQTTNQTTLHYITLGSWGSLAHSKPLRLFKTSIVQETVKM